MSMKRYMRKIALACAAFPLALALASCSTGVDTPSAPTDGEIPRPAACDAEKPYIAVALPNLTNPYYIAMKRGFEEAGAANGFDVEVQIADNDDAVQLAQAQAMIQKKPCAFALNAVKSESGAAIVKAANNAGIPVFTVNVILSDEALKDQGATIVQYLGADNVAGGRQSAEAMMKDFGSSVELKIGFITEPDEVPVLLRDQGFEEAIAADQNATIVARVDGNVKVDDSMRVTTELLTANPEINAVFASTGPASYGALQAVQTLGKDVKVYGFCASEEPLTDQYPFCVAQEPENYGTLVIKEVRGWLDGGTPKAEILRPLKEFTAGQTPAPGEVG